MKKVPLLLVVLLLFNSCASLLNSGHQKIIVNNTNDSEILINGEQASVKEGKYLFERDRLPKQITLKKEGYKDENIVIMQYKKSPLYTLSWIPFGVLCLLPPMYDNGEKAYDYDKEIKVEQKVKSIVKKNETSKEIRVNTTSIKLEGDNIKSRYFPTYKNFIRRESQKVANSAEKDDEIDIENTIFSSALNDILKEKGYIDTTNKVLNNSYLNNLLINSKITDYTYNHIANNVYTVHGGMIYIDLTIEWEILDYYKKPIYTQITTTKSGQFAILDYEKKDEIIHNAIKDAIEYGFIQFMESEEVIKHLNDKSQLELEKSFKEIKIPVAKKYVASVSDAIKSSVTIKIGKGHGSGFIISEDGYIVTNYHVVSDTSDSKIVLNDGTEHEFSVVRVSKIFDLALLKIKAKKLIPFQISDSKEIEIASDIYAVGTPTAEDLSQTISKGIISGIRKTDNNSKLIQTDASINSGNSGGAIVSKEGVVLGVVSSKLKGFGIEGVAFGIPAYEITDRLNIKVQ